MWFQQCPRGRAETAAHRKLCWLHGLWEDSRHICSHHGQKWWKLLTVSKLWQQYPLYSLWSRVSVCVKQRRPAWPFPGENSGVWVCWLSLVHSCSHTVPHEHPQDLLMPFVHRRFFCWFHCVPFCWGNSQLWLLRSKNLHIGSLSWQWSWGPLTPG